MKVSEVSNPKVSPIGCSQDRQKATGNNAQQKVNGGKMTRTDKTAPTCSGDKVVRMFPNNELKKPVRPFAATFSVAIVLKQMFPLSK